MPGSCLTVIKAATLIDEYDAIPWKLDTRKFAQTYPSEYEKYKQGGYLALLEDEPTLARHLDEDWAVRDFITMILAQEEGVNFEDSHIWRISREIPSIAIVLENGKNQEITNLSLYGINGDAVDAFEISFECNFLFCRIFRAFGQAGTLGIWDSEVQGWCFAYTNELFCVDEITFDEATNEFHGSFFYDFPMSPACGEGLFKITKDRQLETIRYHYITSDGTEKNGVGRFFD